MTAFPTTMCDDDIHREHLQQEARVLLEAPRVNLPAFVRNLFDSQLVGSIGFKTADDLYRYAEHLLEQRAGRKLNHGEITKLGIATASEFNTRAALAKLVRRCAHCEKTFGLDERRHLVKLAGQGLGVYREGRICTGCLERYDYRDVLTTDTLRDQMRELGLGVEDYDRAFPRVYGDAECGCCDARCVEPKPCPISDASSDHDAVLFCAECLTECPKCGESVCADHWDKKRRTCKACENQRYVESGEARNDYMRYGRDD